MSCSTTTISTHAFCPTTLSLYYLSAALFLEIGKTAHLLLPQKSLPKASPSGSQSRQSEKSSFFCRQESVVSPQEEKKRHFALACWFNIGLRLPPPLLTLHLESGGDGDRHCLNSCHHSFTIWSFTPQLPACISAMALKTFLPPLPVNQIKICISFTPRQVVVVVWVGVVVVYRISTLSQLPPTATLLLLLPSLPPSLLQRKKERKTPHPTPRKPACLYFLHTHTQTIIH